MTDPTALPIVLDDDLSRVDWAALRRTLVEDDFDNGRTPAELATCFERTPVRVLAWQGGTVVGKARALADGVCNAFVVDVWTRSDLRRQGIATRMMAFLERRLEGHHVALFSAEAPAFYRRLGYEEERVGMSKVVGHWLGRAPGGG